MHIRPLTLYTYVYVTYSGAPIHHLAYQISVYLFVFCYISIGIIIADIKSNIGKSKSHSSQ